MSDVLRASYADLKTVKTRSTVQIILEMPIEALTEVVGLLGAPVPGNEVWVAIARLKTAAEPVAQIEHANDEEPNRPPRPLSQVAAFLCTVQAFKRYIFEKAATGWDHVPNTEEAADWLRSVCQVQSRRELDSNVAAARRFREIRSGYDVWLRDVA